MHRNEIDVESLSPIQAVILLLIGSNKEPLKGRLWLQKGLFLLANNISRLSDEANFEAHHYGPYSEAVEIELNNLKILGLVKEEKGLSLTEKGEILFNRLLEYVPEGFPELVKEVKSDINDLSQDELLAYIYFSFPETTTESRTLERIQRNRKNLALSLYKKGKISLSKGAEIAGMSVKEFMDFLRAKKIRIPLEY